MAMPDETPEPKPEVTFKARTAEVTPPGYITGQEVCRRLGIHTNELKSLAKRHVIVRDPRRRSTHGNNIYEEAKVEELQKNREKTQKLMTAKSERVEKLTRIQTYLHPAHVSATAPYLGEQGLIVFEMIRKEKLPADIVLDTGLHPAIVMSILKDYAELNGLMVLSRAAVQEIQAFPNEGKPITHAAQVVKLVGEAIYGRLCKKCRPSKKPALPLCGACATAVVHGRDAKREMAKMQATVVSDNDEETSSVAPVDTSTDLPEPI